MLGHIVLRHHAVALVGLHAFGNHGLVGHQQQGACRDVVGKPAAEEGGRLHVHCHGARLLEVFLELVVVLPDAAVGGIDGTGPVVAGMVADRRRHGTLQHEGRQCRYFGRKIVVRRTFAADGRNGKNQVPQPVLLVDTSALAQEQAGLGMDGAEQVHDDGGIGTSHTEVNDGDALGTGRYHVGVTSQDGHIELLGKQLHILVEVGQQDVFAEVFQRAFGVTWQPVGYNFFFSFHTISLIYKD